MKMMGLSLVILLLGAAPPLASAAPGKRPKKVKKLKKPDQGWKQYVRYQKRAYLGVHLLPLTQELRSFFKTPEDAGVLVSRVEEGSPAHKAGLEVGDLLLSAAGKNVTSAWQVARLVRAKKEGENLELQVLRQGSTRTLSATLKLRKKPTMEVSRFIFRYPGGEVRFPRGWDDSKFQERMERLKGRYRDLAQPEGLFQLKRKERRMEDRLKKLEEKIRKMEKKLSSKRTAL